MIQSSRMSYLRRQPLLLAMTVLSAMLGATLTARASPTADHTPPAVQPATDFAAVEVHADEKLPTLMSGLNLAEVESLQLSKQLENARSY